MNKKVTTVLCTVLMCTSLFAAGKKETKLAKAVESGDIERVRKELAAHPEQVNTESGKYHQTPMKKAVRYGYGDIMILLCQAGGTITSNDLNDISYTKNTALFTQLFEAGCLDVNDSVRYLTYLLNDKTIPLEEQLSNLNAATLGKMTSPYILTHVDINDIETVKNYFSLDLNDPIDSTGKTLLQQAASNFNYELVSYLVEKVNLNATNNIGQNALFFACTAYGPAIHEAEPVIESTKEARIHWVSDMPYYTDPKTLQSKQMQIVELLLSSSIDINNQDDFGWTVLHYASAGYSEGMQELLIQNGADTTLKTNFGRTPSELKTAKKTK